MSLLGVVSRLTRAAVPDEMAGVRLVWKPLAVVCFAGANLTLIQWVLVRELTALLLGTEVITLLVSVSYFAGLSVGYAAAHRIPRRLLIPLAVLTLILHLALPVWFRLVVSGLAALDFSSAAYLLLPLLTPFVISAFYSIFLPVFADNDKQALPVLYAAELIGAVFGILALLVLGASGAGVVLAVYLGGFVILLASLGARWPMVASIAILGSGWLGVFPALNTWSNTLWYQSTRGFPPETQTLFTGYSAYQKVDVLETVGGRRFLFLDGLEHFGAGDGSRLNVMLGEIPARLVQPEQALVVGAGSMEMERLIAEQGGHVHSVEIDPMVVEVSVRYFDAFNAMSTLSNRSVTLDDAKHFLAQTDEVYDLVSTDTPAAYSLQTASLYSVPFYEMVAARLSPNGALAANLTSTFAPDSVVARRVAASLLNAFDQVLVITPVSAGWSFAYAGDALPFNREQLAAALRASGEAQFVIYDTAAVKAIVGDAPPITQDALDIALQVSLNWLGGRFAP